MEQNGLPNGHPPEVQAPKPSTAGRYGWGKFAPDCIQIFNKPQFLLTCLCAAIFSSTLSGAIMPAVIGTLEKRFHLTSLQSGIMNSSYDVATLCIVMFVCHFGEKGHKGKWIGIGSIIYGIGSIILTLPHYVAGKFNPTGIDYTNPNGTCPSNFPRDICGVNDSSIGINVGYAILLLGQVIRGFGATCLGTLMIAYIDENTSQRSSPFYISVTSAVGLIAMAMGYLIGGEFLDFYGDFDTVPAHETPNRNDPNWYGCWWMGYFIGGGLAFLMSIPILGFPQELPNRKIVRQLDDNQVHEPKKQQQAHGSTGFGGSWKDMPTHIITLVKNPVFTCLTLRNTLDVMFGSGWAVFLPKFLQNMYGIEPSQSAMLSGAICLGPLVAGTLLGGWLIKRFEWKVRAVLTFGFVTTVLGSIVGLGILFYCPTRPTVGSNVDYSGKQLVKPAANSLYDTCNNNCSCPTAEYRPICFVEAKITYYSPCFAGCTESESDPFSVTFSNCRCIKDHFPLLSSNATILTGECPYDSYCVMQRNGFIGSWVVICILFGMSGMPLLQSFLRSVPFSQRTLALGLQAIPLRLLGTIPGPIVMGMIYDQSCILWKRYCGESLSCLLYDNEKLMQIVLYSGAVIRTLSAALLMTAILLYRPPKQKQSSGYSNEGQEDASTAESNSTNDYDNSAIDDMVQWFRRISHRQPSAS